MCCGRKDPTRKSNHQTEPSSANPPRSRTPSISSYTPDQKLRQDRIIHNQGWANSGLSEKQQRAMAQTFSDEIQKAKDRGEW
ncbi:hypothetical protein FAGAP_3414 [Fusarium agapanthi]|uniref:Uncharacterized protein n=1 Tax=Fusarium agapanthi TaxID=1803897 RepID=A0A9P5BFK0_9HYPO|nr:hypothetical protein FAGAP_3414 [Fusarium agapanthi]